MENIIIDIEAVANKLGDWIKGEFNEAQSLYNKFTEIEKSGATYAYGVIAIINQNLDKEGSLIIPIIQKIFPELTLSVLQGFIDKLLNDLNIGQTNVPLTLEDGLTVLVGYLKQFKGSTWASISQGLGNLLAIAFSPETPIQKFVQVAELVYQGIIKPLLDK